MNELKDTIEILKARRLEIAFIICISFLASLSLGISDAYPEYQSWLGLTSLGLTLVNILIYLGFLRTIYLESDKRFSLTDLIHKGKRFFLRYFVLGLLYLIFLVVIAQVVFHILKIALSIDGGLREAGPVIARLCWFITMLILIKPYLLIPALIIVLDCGIFESVKFLKHCKLFQVKVLLLIYGIKIASPIIWLLLTNYKESELTAFTQTVFSLSFYAMYQVFTLIIFIMAVRFIASQDFVPDYNTDLINLE